jgi:hypothetical protein
MGCFLWLAVAIMVAATFDPIGHCDFAPMEAKRNIS